MRKDNAIIVEIRVKEGRTVSYKKIINQGDNNTLAYALSYIEAKGFNIQKALNIIDIEKDSWFR